MSQSQPQSSASTPPANGNGNAATSQRLQQPAQPPSLSHTMTMPPPPGFPHPNGRFPVGFPIGLPLSPPFSAIGPGGQPIALHGGAPLPTPPSGTALPLYSSSAPGTTPAPLLTYPGNPQAAASAAAANYVGMLMAAQAQVQAHAQAQAQAQVHAQAQASVQAAAAAAASKQSAATSAPATSTLAVPPPSSAAPPTPAPTPSSASSSSRSAAASLAAAQPPTSFVTSPPTLATGSGTHSGTTARRKSTDRSSASSGQSVTSPPRARPNGAANGSADSTPTDAGDTGRSGNNARKRRTSTRNSAAADGANAGSSSASSSQQQQQQQPSSNINNSNSNDNNKDDDHDDNDKNTSGGKRRKRKKVNHACVYCRRSHMTCDEGRPCQRCIKRHIGHLCHDEPRGPHPAGHAPSAVTATIVDPATAAAAVAAAMMPLGAVPYSPALAAVATLHQQQQQQQQQQQFMDDSGPSSAYASGTGTPVLGATTGAAGQVLMMDAAGSVVSSPGLLPMMASASLSRAGSRMGSPALGPYGGGQSGMIGGAPIQLAQLNTSTSSSSSANQPHDPPPSASDPMHSLLAPELMKRGLSSSSSDRAHSQSADPVSAPASPLLQPQQQQQPQQLMHNASAQPATTSAAPDQFGSWAAHPSLTGAGGPTGGFGLGAMGGPGGGFTPLSFASELAVNEFSVISDFVHNFDPGFASLMQGLDPLSSGSGGGAGAGAGAGGAGYDASSAAGLDALDSQLGSFQGQSLMSAGGGGGGASGMSAGGDVASMSASAMGGSGPGDVRRDSFSTGAAASTSARGQREESTAAPRSAATPATGAAVADGAGPNDDKYLLQLADPVAPKIEDRLKAVINAKYEAGQLQPYNYGRGYARLQRYLETHMSVGSRHRVMASLGSFRPMFRQVAQSLTDMDLILVEEMFERLLLDYDHLFSAMGVPACLWRRTGEIYKANHQFADLVGVPLDQLRDGRVAIYELMSEDAAVNYWDKFGGIAFDPGQKAVLTSCSLKSKARDGRETVIPCCFSFTIRRDKYNMPVMIVGNFLPTEPAPVSLTAIGTAAGRPRFG